MFPLWSWFGRSRRVFSLLLVIESDWLSGVNQLKLSVSSCLLAISSQLKVGPLWSGFALHSSSSHMSHSKNGVCMFSLWFPEFPPQTKNMRFIWDWKLLMSLNFRVNICLGLYFRPVIDCRPVKGEPRLSPDVSWLQLPVLDKNGENAWMKPQTKASRYSLYDFMHVSEANACKVKPLVLMEQYILAAWT